MFKLRARVERNAPDQTNEGNPEADLTPEISTQQHIAAVRQGNRRGYRRLFMGALMALGIVAAIPRSVSPIPLMARAKLEAVDHKHGLDKKEIEWRAQLQKMADENRYEELDISEFFENLQLLAWGVDPDSVESANEIMDNMVGDMIARAQVHIPQKDIVSMLAAKIAGTKHSPDQNSTAYMMNGEKIEGKVGGNCVARFGALASLYAQAFPAYAEFMRMDVRRWKENGEYKAHIALYINGRAFLPFKRGAGLTEDWYIVDGGRVMKANHPPSHVEVTLKRALVDSFLGQASVWTQERVWVPTDMTKPPEHETPMTLYDKNTEVNTGKDPGPGTTKFAIETEGVNGEPVILTFYIDENGEDLIIREVVTTGTGENEGRILDRQVMDGGPKIAACYDFVWSLIDERQLGHPDVQFQLLDGQGLREWGNSSTRRRMFQGADMITITGEASNNPNRVNGEMHFGATAGIARHSRQFSCFLRNTGVERKILRGNGDINILNYGAQTSTWEVTGFILEDGPTETTTPLGDGLWGRDDIEK